jgi:putative transposase
MKKAMKRHGKVAAITIDALRSCTAARDELGCPEKQEVGRWANNRVENSHLSFCQHFDQERHLVDRQTYKERRSAVLAEWQAPMLSEIDQVLKRRLQAIDDQSRVA